MLVSLKDDLKDEERIAVKYIIQVFEDRLNNEVALSRHILKLACYSVAMTTALTGYKLEQLNTLVSKMEEVLSGLSDEDVVAVVKNPRGSTFKFHNTNTDKTVLDLGKVFAREIERIDNFITDVSIKMIRAESGCSVDQVMELIKSLEEADWKDDEELTEDEWELAKQAEAATEKAEAKRKGRLH